VAEQTAKVSALENTMTTGFDNLRQHQEKVLAAEKANHERQLASLKTDRRAAIKDGDSDLAESIDSQMDALRNADFTPPPRVQPAPAAQPVNPYFAEWHQENDWYRSDPALTKIADSLIPVYEGKGQDEILDLIAADVKKLHPEKFQAQAPAAPEVPAVEAPTRRSTGKKKFTSKDLNESQKAIMKQFVDYGAMTEEEYIKDLAKIGDAT